MDEDSDPSELVYDDDDDEAFDAADFDGDEVGVVDDDDSQGGQVDIGVGGIDDDEFTQDISNKNKLKNYEVEYTCLSIDGLQQQQKKDVDHIASMFEIKDTDAAILLRHLNWNKERLIEKYMDNEEQLKVQAGVLDDPARPKLQQSKDFTCSVCFMSSDDEDSGKMETLALGCDHRFCKDCYQHYVEQKVKEEGESRRVQCMQEKCKLVIDEKTIQLLVTPPVYER